MEPPGNRGHGPHAWNTLTNWLAAQPGLRNVTAGMLECNHGMRRVAERSGMQLEGVRAQEMVDAQPRDILSYAGFGPGRAFVAAPGVSPATARALARA